MHDIDDLERRGLAGVVVASEPFAEAAEEQARALGLDVARVFTPHPIQDRSDDEMREITEAAFDAIRGALTES